MTGVQTCALPICFGLNIVSGWNPGEFNMMGVPLNSHEDRYAYSREWIEITKRIWSEDKPFDYDGRFFKLKDVLLKPKPQWRTRPILVAAGNSPTGRDYAASTCDCLFTTIPKADELKPKIDSFRSMAPPGQLKNIFASCHLMARKTRKEAMDYRHYIIYEQGDWEAAEYSANFRGNRVNTWMKEQDDLKARLIMGAGYPLVGSYDDVVEEMVKFSEMGLDGFAWGMINYVRDLPHITDEIIPRMERVGLREKRKAH